MNKSRLALAFGVLSLGLGVAPKHAHAQPHLGGPPRVTWLPVRPGDSAGTGGHGDRLDELAIESFRLGLMGGMVPFGQREPGCQEHSEAMGTATAGAPGFPLQYATAVRLVPRLTLFGMSRAGCARDAAIGGGAVFVVPITPKIGLALGGGTLFLPNNGPGGSAIVRVQARAEIIFARPGGRSFSVGLASGNGGTRISVSGVF